MTEKLRTGHKNWTKFRTKKKLTELLGLKEDKGLIGSTKINVKIWFR